MKNIWNATQIVASNGAYGGKIVTFAYATFEGTEQVTGELQRANSSIEEGKSMLLVSGDWYWVPDETPVEVL